MKNSQYHDDQKFRKQLSNWIETRFLEFSKESNPIHAQRFVTDNLLFATVRTSAARLPGLDQREATFKRYGVVYNALLAQLDRNYHRHRHLQPLSFAFFDQEGTKLGASISGNSVTPHVHAVILLNPANASKFWQVGLGPFVSGLCARNFSGVTNIDVQRFDPRKGSIADLVDYSAKAYHRNFGRHPNLSADLLTIYPDRIR